MHVLKLKRMFRIRILLYYVLDELLLKKHLLLVKKKVVILKYTRVNKNVDWFYYAITAWFKGNTEKIFNNRFLIEEHLSSNTLILVSWKKKSFSYLSEIMMKYISQQNLLKKQVETRTADGRRRITPLCIAQLDTGYVWKSSLKSFFTFLSFFFFSDTNSEFWLLLILWHLKALAGNTLRLLKEYSFNLCSLSYKISLLIDKANSYYLPLQMSDVYLQVYIYINTDFSVLCIWEITLES